MPIINKEFLKVEALQIQGFRDMNFNLLNIPIK